MAWSDSAVFVQTVATIFGKIGTAPTGYTSMSADTLKAAVYLSNTMTPSSTDTLAHAAYNAAGSPWVNTNEESTAGGYTQGGTAITQTWAIGNGSPVPTNYVALTSTNTSWTSVTFANAYGALVYDSSISAGTVANQGLCYNYFGGNQSVTSGTFTIAWNANGVFNFQVGTP